MGPVLPGPARSRGCTAESRRPCLPQWLPSDWFGCVQGACPFLKVLIKSVLGQKEDAGRTLFLPQAGEVTREVGGRRGTRAAGARGPCRKRLRWGFAICPGSALLWEGEAAVQRCWGGGCVSRGGPEGLEGGVRGGQLCRAVLCQAVPSRAEPREEAVGVCQRLPAQLKLLFKAGAGK